MTPKDQQRMGAQTVWLRDGREAELRPLAVTDGRALGDFYLVIPVGDRRFYCPHDLTREQAVRNAAAADHPQEIVIVLQAPDGLLAGYGWVRWRDERSASGSFGLCVHPAWQNTGAGRVLVQRVMAVTHEIGPATVSLTVQKANPRAVRLYRQAGFEIVREQIRRTNPRWGLPEEPEYQMVWHKEGASQLR